MNIDTNKKFWERYAKLYKYVIEETNRKMYKNICSEIITNLNKKQNVLELACGSGQITKRIVDKVNFLTATDFSPNMVKETSKRVNAKNVTFDVCDATKINYEDNSFDVVIISNALHIMPSPEKALKEIKRILKKDGIVIAPTFVYEGKINTPLLYMAEKLGHKVFHKWDSKMYSDFVKENGFKVIDKKVFKGNLLPVCMLTLIK